MVCVTSVTAMLSVPDVDATVAWYQSIGFELVASHGEADDKMDWARVQYGAAAIMFVPSSDSWRARTTGLSLWFDTQRIDELYALLRERQLHAASIARHNAGPAAAVQFTQDLHTRTAANVSFLHS
jgi:catechol 2,3-dioxygenase-like lactoylglutathione lyase family enzyme